MDPIQIQPKIISQFPEQITADYVRVGVISVRPGEGAAGNLELGTLNITPAVEAVEASEGQPAIGAVPEKREFVPALAIGASLTDEQFAAWGTDDEYAVNCMLTNHGLVRA